MRSNNRGSKQTTISTITETDIAVASTLGFAHDLYLLILTNTSASTVIVDLYDGGSTTGTKKFTFTVGAASTGGFSLEIDAAIKASKANTAWTAVCRSAVSSLEVTTAYTRRPATA